MKSTFHYRLEALFYRKEIGNKLDFIIKGGDLKDSITHYYKEFQNPIPIIAREDTFNHFQSFIDVFYDGINKTYTSDEQARIDLQKYFNSGNDIEMIGHSLNKFKVSDDVLFGINIYMIIDVPLFPGDKKGDKILIYGLNYIDYPDKVDEEIPKSIKGLIKECEYFEQSSYSFKDYMLFVDFHRICGKIESILKTPFNFNAFIEKYDGYNLL